MRASDNVRLSDLHQMRKALIETIRVALIDALRYHGGSVNLAAGELMIGRVTLYRKIKELEIQEWEYSAQWRGMVQNPESALLAA